MRTRYATPPEIQRLRLLPAPSPLAQQRFEVLAWHEVPPSLQHAPALLRAGWPDEREPDPEWLKPHLARLRAKLGSVPSAEWRCSRRLS